MSLKADLGKIRGRSIPELKLLTRVFFLLGLFSFLIPLFSFQKISNWIGLKPGTSFLPAAEENAPFLLQLEWAVRAAARRTPWDSACLAQSLAGAYLLKSKQIPFSLYLGMAKDSHTSIYSAHAWLKCGEKIITGANGHEKFKIVASFIPEAGSRKIARIETAGNRNTG